MKADIATRDDIVMMVQTFYDRVLQDSLLAPHFVGIDLPTHLPRMIDFWCFSILEEGSFKGNIFDKHVHLKIDETHFKRWLLLFHQTVDEMFAGDYATKALQRADLIGYTFASKMATLNNDKTT